MLNAKRFTITITIFLSAAISTAQAQSWGRLGSEFQSNTYTTDNQDYPSVATDANGNFVVVWQSRPYGEGGNAQDGSYSGVFGQRFTSAGADVGTEFQINTYTTESQYSADVAAASDGRFVVVWTSYGQDGDNAGIFAQRYDSTGVPAGTEFQVNTYTTNGQRSGHVASTPTGDFVVVWSSYTQDEDSGGIFAQRFNSSGGKLGTEFQVNGDSTGNQIAPDVAFESSGGFVVVWNTAYPFVVFGRRFDSAGAPLGTDFQVGDLAVDRESYPAVAADTSGGFVVAWQAELAHTISTGPTVVDDNDFSIQARRFNSTGAPLGSQFQVNTYTSGAQVYPAIATAPSGDFVVVWQSGSYYNYEPDGSASGVFGQRFSNTGAFLGTEFLVNTYTTYGQEYPAIAAGPNDFFVVAWQSHATGNYDLVTGAPQLGPRDPNGLGVFGQRFGAAPLAPGTAPALSPAGILLLAAGLGAVGLWSLLRRHGRRTA